MAFYAVKYDIGNIFRAGATRSSKIDGGSGTYQ